MDGISPFGSPSDSVAHRSPAVSRCKRKSISPMGLRKSLSFDGAEGRAISPDTFSLPSRFSFPALRTISGVELSLPFQGRKKVSFSPLIEKILQIHDNLQISREDRVFTLKAVFRGAGDYFQVYRIESIYPFIEGIPNERLLIKIVKEDLFTDPRRGPSARANFEKRWISNILSQYDRCQDAHLPIASMYNRETAATDGYFVMEKVIPLEGSVQARLWTKDHISSEAVNILSQIKVFFDYALQDSSYLPLDVKISNLGIREDGVIVLYDFREEEVDKEFPVEIPFGLFARNALKGFAQGNLEVFAFLCDGIKGTSLYNTLMEDNGYRDRGADLWSWERSAAKD